MNRILIPACGMAACLAIPVNAGAAVINTTVENRLDKVGAAAATVSGGSLAVGDGASAATPPEYRNLFEFDISGSAADIAAADTIELSFQVNAPVGNPLDFDVVALDAADGQATSSDFSSAGSVVQFIAADTLSNGQIITVDVTSQVKADSVAGETFSAFRLQTNDADLLQDGEGDFIRLFKTGESGSDQGALLTTVVPEPGSMALAGLGSLVLFARGRSKRLDIE